MSNTRDPLGPFTINCSLIMYHNYRLDPASKGRHLMRLPDRTLGWPDEYEQRLNDFRSNEISVNFRDKKDC